ncbi:MAG: DUF3530 family protein [Gammaproteobacteria bacterium]|nr:DUF3530 family protein [Gammaproteobacteria bacterium]
MSALYRTCLTFSVGLYCLASNAADQTPDAALEPIAPAAQIERSPILGRNVLAAQAIQLSADAKQLIDLTTAVEHFSALFLPANVAEPRGMVILLPGAEESFDWPVAIGTLRRNLPDAGWHTLSLNLPELPIDTPSPHKVTADDVAEQIPVLPPEPVSTAEEDTELEPEEAVETEAEEEVTSEELAPAAPPEDAEPELESTVPAAIVIPAYPERIDNFIDAAIAYAQTLNAAEVVLLGHHEGAHWVLNYQGQAGTSLPLRRVLISPRSSVLLNTSYIDLIETSQQPIADFYYKNDTLAHHAAQQRLAASRRAARKDYRQISLTTGTAVQALEQEYLLRRVKGWLNKPVEQ